MTTLYLTEPGTVVRYRNESLLIVKQQQSQTCRVAELTLIVVLPGVQLTDVAIAQLLDRGIETIFLRQDGQFRGRLQGQIPTNPMIRLAQYRMVETTFGMALAQKFAIGSHFRPTPLTGTETICSMGRASAAFSSLPTYTPHGDGNPSHQLIQMLCQLALSLPTYTPHGDGNEDEVPDFLNSPTPVTSDLHPSRGRKRLSTAQPKQLGNEVTSDLHPSRGRKRHRLGRDVRREQRHFRPTPRKGTETRNRSTVHVLCRR